MSVQQELERLGEDVTYAPGAVRHVPEVVDRLDGSRVLLICGRRSFEASGAAAILPELERRATVLRFSDFTPNTSVGNVAAGLERWREFEPDLVVAIGGGSAMDLAKLLCAFEAAPDLPSAIEAGRRIEQRRPGLVLVPTTSGSGSEATHFAVVYLGQDKHSVAGPAMLPDHVVLDPELSRSSSARQRAISGIDAVCQAIESMWAVDATDESREEARRALPLLLEHLSAFVREPDPTAAEAMCVGSHLAGKAINISKTTAPHALSYGLTMRHGVSHGHAVALTLGAFLELHAEAGGEQLQPSVDPAVHAAAMGEVLSLLGAADGPDARGRFEQLLSDVGLEHGLAFVGLDSAEERGALARAVNAERLGNNPVILDQRGLKAVLAAA